MKLNLTSAGRRGTQVMKAFSTLAIGKPCLANREGDQGTLQSTPRELPPGSPTGHSVLISIFVKSFVTKRTEL